VSIVWGWLLIGIMNFIVGLSMAEICESPGSHSHTPSPPPHLWSQQCCSSVSTRALMLPWL
jgi:hypothetical protein